MCIKTQVLLHSQTSHLNCGTVPFIAPELLRRETASATIKDLRKADIWAFCMIVFCCINPDQHYSFQVDLMTPLNPDLS